MSVARSLVTDASRGLGLSIFEALLARGDEVLAAWQDDPEGRVIAATVA